MDEFRAILKARELAKKVNPTAIPADVMAYAAHVGAVGAITAIQRGAGVAAAQIERDGGGQGH